MGTRINEENRKCKTNNVLPNSQYYNIHVENTVNNELLLLSNIYILPFTVYHHNILNGNCVILYIKPIVQYPSYANF